LQNKLKLNESNVQNVSGVMNGKHEENKAEGDDDDEGD